jgi:hypothetical protein
VPLARPQSIDDAQPSHVQLMNRVGTIPSYYATIGTTIFVVIVAIGATYVRGQVLEKQLHQQVVGQAVSTTELPAKLSKDGLDMSVKENRQGIKLPAEDAAQNKRATDKAQEDEASIDRHGGWGTFIVLAFIFVFLQILSIFFGFRWGFAGKDSESAYRAIGGGRYASYADVLAHHKDVADTAQSKLEHLQQKLMNNNTNTGTDGLHTTKTFYEFIDLERERETNQLAKEKQRTAQHADMEKRKTAGTYVQVSATDPMTEPATVTLDEAMRYLDKMGENKEDKKAYVRNLPDALQTEVIEALKGQQALKRDKELDDLLG